MPTPFSFDHVFEVASPQILIDAYFDDDHLATQDKVAELGDRVVVEDTTTDGRRSATWRVTSQRALPMIARPFVDGGRLRYREAMSYRQGEQVVEMSVTPEILGGRVSIQGRYELALIAPDRVKRRYTGSITANIALLSGRIERGIYDAFVAAMPAMSACTQGWLDRTRARNVV